MKQTLSYFSTVFYKSFAAYTSKRLQQTGLNYGSLFFVIYVGKHPNCTPAEMTNALHMDWGHSQRSITKLVQDGFLRKEKSENDHRSYHLTLTEKGQLAFDTSHQVFFDWDAETLSCLSEDEREQLLFLLEKLTQKKEEGHSFVQ